MVRRVWSAIREAIGGTQRDLTDIPLSRAVILLAVPMVLEMAMESIFAVVDIFFVARLGKDAISSVGLTEALLMLIYAIAIGLSISTTAMIARRIGAKKADEAAQTATQAVFLAVGLALVLGAIGGLFAPDLLRLMGASPAILAIGSGYATLMFAGHIVIMLLFVHNAILRGAGDASFAMRSLWLANGINIVLDPCLIFGWGPFPELGLMGAAVATTIGRGTAVIFQIWILQRGSRRISLLGQWRVIPALMGRLVRVSIGGIMQFLIETASFVALVRIVALFGSTALAGYTIGIRVIVFSILPAWGLSNAAATLVGQNLGAGKPERAERAVWLTGIYNMFFLGGLSIVFIVFAQPIVALFHDDPRVLAIGVDCLRIISCGYVFFAWGMVTVQAFNGAGDTMTPTWVNLFCFWLFQIPCAYLLARPLGFGPRGIFAAIAISYSLSAVVGMLLFRRGRWKTRSV